MSWHLPLDPCEVQSVLLASVVISVLQPIPPNTLQMFGARYGSASISTRETIASFGGLLCFID